MRRHFLLMLCITLTLALVAGCATTDDPHAGGFINGLNNLVNGGYQKRVSDKESELQRESSALRDAEQEAEALSVERARLEAQIADANARIKDVEASIARHRAAIEQGRSDTAQAKAKLRQAEDKLATVKESLQELHGSEGPDENLKERSDALKKDLEDLDTIVKMLGEL